MFEETLAAFKAAKKVRNTARKSHAESDLTDKVRATRLEVLEQAESALAKAATAHSSP